MISIATPACPRCGAPSTVKVTPEELERLRSGELIQNALPKMSADQRELLMTGFHPACWDKTFKVDEE